MLVRTQTQEAICGDPRRTSPDQARALIADTPVIVWMAYSVHGNEISPADASMAAAHHLLASRDPAGLPEPVLKA